MNLFVIFTMAALAPTIWNINKTVVGLNKPANTVSDISEEEVEPIDSELE